MEKKVRANKVAEILEEMAKGFDGPDDERAKALRYAADVVRWHAGWFDAETSLPNDSGFYLASDGQEVFTARYTARKKKFSTEKEVKGWRTFPAPYKA